MFGLRVIFLFGVAQEGVIFDSNKNCKSRRKTLRRGFLIYVLIYIEIVSFSLCWMIIIKPLTSLIFYYVFHPSPSHPLTRISKVRISPKCFKYSFCIFKNKPTLSSWAKRIFYAGLTYDNSGWDMCNRHCLCRRRKSITSQQRSCVTINCLGN